jgi:thioredoxin 1
MRKIVQNITEENFQKLVLDATEPIVVTFGFPGCGPCRTLALYLEQLAQEGVLVGKVNIVDDPQLAVDFNVNTAPTTLFFLNGKERYRHLGTAGMVDLKKMLKEASKCECCDSYGTTSQEHTYAEGCLCNV